MDTIFNKRIPCTKTDELPPQSKEVKGVFNNQFPSTGSVERPPQINDIIKISSTKIAAANKFIKGTINKRSFEFVNTESNRDNYLSELVLRKTGNKLKIKLTHYSGSFDYSAFQAIWHFEPNEIKTAEQVFDTVAYMIDGIKEQHNMNQKHPTTLVPIIREAIKPVAESHQYRKNILSIDESDLQPGEADWQQTIYGNKYPAYQEESKQEMFNYDHLDAPVKRTMYTGRNTKESKEI